MTPFPDNIPQPGQLFRHTDGGLYRFTGTARDSRDTTPLYLYDHLWPFEAQTWARPADEWAVRFMPITAAELAEAQRGDRIQAQQAVSAAKAARKAAMAQIVLEEQAARKAAAACR